MPAPVLTMPTLALEQIMVSAAATRRLAMPKGMNEVMIYFVAFKQHRVIVVSWSFRTLETLLKEIWYRSLTKLELIDRLPFYGYNAKNRPLDEKKSKAIGISIIRQITASQQEPGDTF